MQNQMDRTTTTTYPLTVAYDAKRAYLNYRGLGNYCRNLFAQLKQYAPEGKYLLCTPQDEGLYPWLNEAPFERIMPQGVWHVAPSVWRKFGIPSALRDRHVDIYHGLSQELPEGIERLGCKTVVTMHDAIFLRYPHLYSPTYRMIFTHMNRSACRRADLIIAISEQTKRDYMDFFGVEEERIRVVYQGCNDLYWQPIADAQLQGVRTRYDLPHEYVLSVGALEARKNHSRIIEALADAHIALPLVLVGKGNRAFRQQLIDTARRYGIDLRILDNAATQDLPAIYRMALVFVYPSLFEGFGIPILEAARCSTPIVASSGICFDEITADGALYADPLDVAAIGHAIHDTLYDSRQTAERVRKALNHTEKFRAQRIMNDMMDVYRSIL